jgi:hypothetical protein
MAHAYAVDASNLLGQCLQQVNDLIVLQSHGKRNRNGELVCLQSLYNGLKDCYGCLYDFLADIIDGEKENCDQQSYGHLDRADSASSFDHASLLQMVDRFKDILLRQQNYQRHQNQIPYSTSHIVSSQHSARIYGRSIDGVSSNSSTIDSLLFRLTVVLQLCLVRIDDARLAVTGSRLKAVTLHDDIHTQEVGGIISEVCEQKKFRWIIGVSLATTTYFPVRWSAVQQLQSPRIFPSIPIPNSASQADFVVTAVTAIAQLGTTAALLYGLNWNWSTLWMKNKINNSAKEIQSWVEQWKILLNKGNEDAVIKKQRFVAIDRAQVEKEDSIRTQQLINYALENTAQVRSIIDFLSGFNPIFASYSFFSCRVRSGILKESCGF